MSRLKIKNIFNEVLSYNQSRLINLYNLDPISETYGIGDRKFWAWKTIDFPNSTFQSGVTSLAISILKGNSYDLEFYLKLIDGIVHAIGKTSNKNFSLNESFPNENSYCVTALVAFDVLFSIDILKDVLTPKKKDEYIKIVSPHITYLKEHEEKHAFISNHLATAAAALYFWTHLTKKDEIEYQNILNKIYSRQSSEGWYTEYEGPDIGYQTLCTHYLSAIYLKSKNEQLGNSLKKSLRYLRYFLHPDHTIGGLYASRNTEVYYPGGICALSEHFEDAAIIASHMKVGVKNNSNLLPQDIDADNYIPLLNSFAYASLFKEVAPRANKRFYETPNQINFEKCGIELYSNSNYFSILNYKKGGVLKIYDLKSKSCVFESGGLLINYKNKKLTTQRFNENITLDSKRSFSFPLYRYKESYPSSFHTLIIRLLSILFFRSIAFSELFKKAVVKLLMTNKNQTSFEVKMNLEYELNEVRLNYVLPKTLSKCHKIFDQKFKTIHMASSGYTLKNKFVSTSAIVKTKFE